MNHAAKDVILSVKNLKVEYLTGAGVVPAVNGVSFDLMSSERLGLVGESGCGKSTIALGLLRMIKAPNRISGGEAWIDGVNLFTLNDEQMRRVRTRKIGIIPQNAMNSLAPSLKVKSQISDAVKEQKLGLSKQERGNLAISALESVRLPPKIAEMYPHELSNGMKQRVCIAIALSMKPKVIIADELASALDVVAQRQVMETIVSLQDQHGSSAILIDNNLELLAQFATRLAIMYAGKLVEVGTVREILTSPLHPYTQLLVKSLPLLSKRGVFTSIPGLAPSFLDLPEGCVFNPRCPKVMEICRFKEPALQPYGDDRLVSCHLYHQAG